VIDTALDGGGARGELGIILGTTGRGKSMFLVHTGYHAAALGFQVTHLTLEMSGLQIATRYDARWSKLNARKFKTFDFVGEQLDILDAKKRRAASKFNGKINIASVPVETADVNTIRSILEMLSDRGVPDSDLIIVDSADHMKSLRNFEQYRHEQAAVYWNLKSLAQEQDAFVLTSTHAGKEWAEKLIKSEGAAESYDKARIADIIISLNRGRDAERRDISRYLDLFLAKYRDGEDNITVPCRVDRPTMQFIEEDIIEHEEEAS
jgi:replicative DNA helicase